MSFDIYGNQLLPGHCEVHPHVHEEYPCSVCVTEANRKVQAEFGRSWNAEELAALTKERDVWKAKAEANIPLAVGWMYAEACVLADKGEDIREIQAPYFLQRALLDLCHCEYDSARSAEKEKE